MKVATRCVVTDQTDGSLDVQIRVVVEILANKVVRSRVATNDYSLRFRNKVTLAPAGLFPSRPGLV